jgi:hypothetical protein
MKKIAFAAVLGLLATGGAYAQYYGQPSYDNLSGQWVAASERCNCGNMVGQPSIYASGGSVTFTNPCGQSSAGYPVGQGVLRAESWGVNAYILSQSHIRWGDGCHWTRQYTPRY